MLLDDWVLKFAPVIVMDSPGNAYKGEKDVMEGLSLGGVVPSSSDPHDTRLKIIMRQIMTDS
jgi:hypothetical protein